MTSAVLNLRQLVRLTVRQSVRRSFVRTVPRGGLDWAQWPPAQRQQWTVFLTQNLPNQLTMTTTLEWLSSFLLPPEPVPTPAPAGGGTGRPPGGYQGELSVEELLHMLENEAGQYIVHRTANADVGELRVQVIDASQPAGKDDPNAPPGIYAIVGLLGMPYGNWCVFFRKGVVPFTSMKTTAAAGTTDVKDNINKEELICVHDIPISKVHGSAPVASVEAAMRLRDQRRADRAAQNK